MKLMLSPLLRIFDNHRHWTTLLRLPLKVASSVKLCTATTATLFGALLQTPDIIVFLNVPNGMRSLNNVIGHLCNIKVTAGEAVTVVEAVVGVRVCHSSHVVALGVLKPEKSSLRQRHYCRI